MDVLIVMVLVVVVFIAYAYVEQQRQEKRDAEWQAVLSGHAERLPIERVCEALTRRYGAQGYRIAADGLIEVNVRFAGGNGSEAPAPGQQWWGPFGNMNDQHCHVALARILAE